MNKQEFLNFIEANGASWDEYEAFAKGIYDGIISLCKEHPELKIVVGEFNPEDEEYQLKYTEYILGLH